MTNLSKREFYKMLLRDRLPVAKIDFPTEKGNGSACFIHTPLGVMIHVKANDSKLREIKMYDRNRGKFAIQNVFCGENLVCIDDGSYVSISSKLKIEDIVGRSFLIKLDNMNIIARAEFVPRYPSNIDKSKSLVYN